MENEYWKSVLHYEGLYEISNMGNCRSVDRECWNGWAIHLKKGQFIKQHLGTTGYLFVPLSKNGYRTQKYVHHLVAKTFIENPQQLPEVNHKDGNKLNNKLSNLEYVTPRQNMKHAMELGLFNNKGSKHGMSKLIEQDIKEIRYLYHNTNLSRKEIARMFNVCYEEIYRIAHRKIWKHV